MDQSPTQTPENQECQQDSDCRNERVLNTEGPKCEKPAQKNAHRWGNCVLPADHAGFCYYRDSDGEARQANYGTVQASMSQLEAAVKLLAKQRDEALERCSQLELANAALRKAAGL